MTEHMAHIWPDLSQPERAWLTCDGVEIATIALDPTVDSPEKVKHFFRSALETHAEERHNNTGGRAMSEEDYVVRVWWIPQVPMSPFLFPVPDIATGVLLCDALAQYDLFQYENKIKPDYSNVGGVQFLDEDDEWCDIDTDEPDDVERAQTILALYPNSREAER